MILLVTFTFDFTPFLDMTACFDQVSCILATIMMKSCIPIKLESWTLCIGCNGHVPDEYLPDVTKKFIKPKAHNFHIIV